MLCSRRANKSNPDDDEDVSVDDEAPTSVA
jgi:hypothetical protein